MTRPVLGISTSSGRGSVALRADGLLVARAYDALHAEHLLPQLDEVLAEAGCRRGDLAGVACDIGPGSFTGVRVGVACAKGIALGLGLPLAGVVSLAAMAHDAFAAGALAPSDVAMAVLDAKRGEVFAAAYDASGAVLLAPLHTPNAEAASLAARIPGRRVVLVGAAAHALGLGPASPLGRGDLPDAASVALVGSALLARAAHDPAARAEVDPAVLEPLYVRAPDAKPSGVVL